MGRLPCHASIAPLFHLSRWRTTLPACYWLPGHTRSRQVPTIHHTFSFLFQITLRLAQLRRPRINPHGRLRFYHEAHVPWSSVQSACGTYLNENSIGALKLMRSSGDPDCRMNAAAVRVWWFPGSHHAHTPHFCIIRGLSLVSHEPIHFSE